MFHEWPDVASLLTLLLQGIAGQRLLSIGKGWSGVTYAKGDKKGSIEALFFLNFLRTNISFRRIEIVRHIQCHYSLAVRVCMAIYLRKLNNPSVVSKSSALCSLGTALEPGPPPSLLPTRLTQLFTTALLLSFFLYLSL